MDVPDDPHAALAAGWQAFRLADYDQAAYRFSRIAEQPGLSPSLEARARHGLASVWDVRQPVPRQDDERAAALYRQVIDLDPASDVAAWSLLALARMHHLVPVDHEPDLDAVRTAYQAVIDQVPGHLAGHEALLYQQSTWIMTLDPADTRVALDRLETFLADYPDSPFASAAYNLIAQGYETLDDPDRQLAARLRELETLEIDSASPASTDLSWRYWQLATTAEFGAGRFDLARTYYQRLIDEYPRDHRKFAARQALMRMDALEQQLRAEHTP
jgi:tetratricopeptide (TPR) repeat protein